MALSKQIFAFSARILSSRRQERIGGKSKRNSNWSFGLVLEIGARVLELSNPARSYNDQRQIASLDEAARLHFVRLGRLRHRPRR